MKQSGPDAHRPAVESVEEPVATAARLISWAALGALALGVGFFLKFGLAGAVRSPQTLPAPTSEEVLPVTPPDPVTVNQIEESEVKESAPAEAERISLPDLAKVIPKSVVQIISLDKDGRSIGVGTGFAVRDDGVIATNRHVIERASTLKILAADRSEVRFDGVLNHPTAADIVLIKVEGYRIPALPLGEDDRVEAGEDVAVVGSPLGLDGTLSSGIVSAVRLNEDAASAMTGDSPVEFIQITAPISPGSSGSPVINSKGKVIGVATSRITEGESLNFALPIRHVEYLIIVAGDYFPVNLSAAFPQPVIAASPPDKIAPAELYSPDELKEFAKEIALAYLLFGDSTSYAKQGDELYSDPVRYFDRGIIPKAQAIQYERDYEMKWPIRLHATVNGPTANEIGNGEFEVFVTSIFAISDNKSQFKRITATTGLVIAPHPDPKVLAAWTVKSESERLNKIQFRRLVDQISRSRQ